MLSTELFSASQSRMDAHGHNQTSSRDKDLIANKYQNEPRRIDASMFQDDSILEVEQLSSQIVPDSKRNGVAIAANKTGSEMAGYHVRHKAEAMSLLQTSQNAAALNQTTNNFVYDTSIQK